MRVEFITRQDCELCDEAEEILSGWAGDLGLEVDVVDVDRDQALLAVFTDRVPVLRSADGEVLVEGRWDSQAPTALVRGL